MRCLHVSSLLREIAKTINHSSLLNSVCVGECVCACARANVHCLCGVWPLMKMLLPLMLMLLHRSLTRAAAGQLLLLLSSLSLSMLSIAKHTKHTICLLSSNSFSYIFRIFPWPFRFILFRFGYSFLASVCWFGFSCSLTLCRFCFVWRCVVRTELVQCIHNVIRVSVCKNAGTNKIPVLTNDILTLASQFPRLCIWFVGHWIAIVFSIYIYVCLFGLQRSVGVVECVLTMAKIHTLTHTHSWWLTYYLPFGQCY